jgi:hypothetical protein
MYNADFGFDNEKDCTIKDGAVTDLNAYARVKSISGNVIEIENATESEFANFTAGQEIILHVSATNGTDAEFLGAYDFYTIELVSDNRLTLDKNIFAVDLNFFYAQIITVPQFKNLKLINATIAPPPFDVFKFTGGIVVFKVFNDFVMQNSCINLVDCGIPVQKKLTFRPLQMQEYDGETDGAIRAGDENFITASRFILNAGDGAAMILAKNFVADDESRIGNPKTHGRINCRGAVDSPFKPSNVTNIGGSSILIAADFLQIKPTLLAKYRDADKPQGRGLCRCHIASNSILANDEKLYSFDILADYNRVEDLGVENFGAGKLGDFVNPQFQLNNSADVESVIGRNFTLKNQTLNGLQSLTPDCLVLIRNADGDFEISRVYNENTVFGIYVANFPDKPKKIFTIPEFENLTLENYTADKFLGVVVADTLTLNGDISVTNALDLNCGNSQSWNKCAGIFFLAKKIIFGENCRLRAGTMIIAETLENFSENVFESTPNFIYQKRIEG